MVNRLILVFDNLVLEFGDIELPSFVGKLPEARCKFGEQCLHPSPSICRESNFRMIKVELFAFE